MNHIREGQVVEEDRAKTRLDMALGVAMDITDHKQAEEAVRTQLEEPCRWHQATLGRESRILELKREVNEFRVHLGQPPRYNSVCDEEANEPPDGMTP